MYRRIVRQKDIQTDLWLKWYLHCHSVCCKTGCNEDRWTDGQMDRRQDRWIHGWTDGRINVQSDSQTKRQIDGLSGIYTAKVFVAKMAAKETDGQTDGQMDRRMDGQTDG